MYRFESQRDHIYEKRAPPLDGGDACIYGDFTGFCRVNQKGLIPFYSVYLAGSFPIVSPDVSPYLRLYKCN